MTAARDRERSAMYVNAAGEEEGVPDEPEQCIQLCGFDEIRRMRISAAVGPC